MRNTRLCLTAGLMLALLAPMGAASAAPQTARAARHAVPMHAVAAHPATTYDHLCRTPLKRLKTLRASTTRTYSYDALTLQDALVYLDFPPPVPIKLDGWYGPATASAVKAYQRSRHLYVDGVVGPQTWRQLRQEIC